jgi:Ca2+-binding EF-hand superfamily protein
VQPAIHELQRDWAKALGKDVKDINWKKSEINFDGFKKLMDPSWSEKDLKSLFALYDFDGNGSISWREYVCVRFSLLSNLLNSPLLC